MDALTAPAAAPARPKKRTGTSKYDFFKVKVWLGEHRDHYYILSRFLICRMLTVTKIPYVKAIKIALETKKYLVDNNLHDVTQAQLEATLFRVVRSKGFDEAHIDCYRLVTAFYQSRQPLVILICGTAWTGKSTLAQQLAARINIPNVMQTDVIYELLAADADSPLHQAPLWARGDLQGSSGSGSSAAGGPCDAARLVAEYRREARVVRRGMDGDLIKTLSDGKPIIVEGLHLDPGLIIPDLAARGLIMLPARPPLLPPLHVPSPRAAHAAVAAGRSPGADPLIAAGSRGGYQRSSTLPARAAAAPAAAGEDCDGAGPARVPDDAGRPWLRQQPLPSAGEELAAAPGSTDEAAAAATALGALALHAEAPVAAGSRQLAARDDGSTAAGQQPQPMCTTSTSRRSHQHRGSPAIFASATAAAVAAGVVNAADGDAQHDSLLGSPEQPTVVVALDDVQVSAAAAEAVALQHHHRQQQQQQQQQRQWQGLAEQDGPGRPLSRDSDAISVEHSTTDVISRACSCASLGSPAHTLAGHEPPAHAGQLHKQLSSGCFAARQASNGLRLQQQQQQPGMAAEAAEEAGQAAAGREAPGGAGCSSQAAGKKPRPRSAPARACSTCGGLPPLPPLPAHHPPTAPSPPPLPPPLADAGAEGAAGAITSQPAAPQQQQQQPPALPVLPPDGPGAGVGTPLFVPILVCMDEVDHVLMAEEALPHLAAAAAGGAGDVDANTTAEHGGGGGSAAAAPPPAPAGAGAALPEALRRMRLLQDYLIAYEAQGLPVVRVSYGAFGEALDKLHEYVLQCIKVAAAGSRG